MKDIRLTYRYFVLMAVAVLMAGCNDTDMPVVEEPVDEVVSFSGEIREKGVISRAGTDDDENEWLDMSYDTWMWSNGSTTGKAPIDFFIHQNALVDGNAQTATAVYRLKPGETNRLVCNEGETPLNWLSKTATHTFRAWTKPEGVTMDPSPVSGKVDMTNRNLDYEYFVGATTNELSYAEHGLTVALKFEHLIGKLVIDNVSLIYSDGVKSDNMMNRVGAIYFPNMPTAGVFNTGVGDGSNMAVTINPNSSKGIFFSLAGNADYGEYIESLNIPFYVLPMLFADDNNYGKFHVNFYHPDGSFRRYEGNLKDLVNESDPENTLTGIKAGECLTLRLVLKDDVVDGFFAYVENWIDHNNQPVKEAPYPGIFTPEDLAANLNLKDWPYILTPSEDVIYETTPDGKKIVRIYDNLDFSGYNLSSVQIIVPDGYVLDGLGHNISGVPVFVIEGDVRNLYVNDELCGTQQ